MAGKILTPAESIQIAKQVKLEGKKIILVGGCFDILHFGHISFLKKAKKTGDTLFVLLEGDESVKRKKGSNRPINKQTIRTLNLKKLYFIDYIILLPLMTKNEEYDRLVTQIKPDIIASTENDPNSAHKRRQAELVGGKYIEVIKRIPHFSTSSAIKEKLK